MVDLQTQLLAALAAGLGGDMALYHQVRLAPGSAGEGDFQEVVVTWPVDPSRMIWGISPYPAVAAHSPLIGHFLCPSASQTVSVARLLTRREWHQNPVYVESFHRLDVQDHVAVAVAIHEGVFHGFTVTRGGSRSFSTADLRLLDLLRPHLRAALRRILEAGGGYEAILTVPTPVLGRFRGPALDLGAARVQLTAREQGVLDLVGEGLDNRRIARRLGIAPRTVDKHLENSFAKLGASNRVEALELARRTTAGF